VFVACDYGSSQTEWSVVITPFASFHGPVIDNDDKLVRAASPDEIRGPVSQNRTAVVMALLITERSPRSITFMQSSMSFRHTTSCSLNQETTAWRSFEGYKVTTRIIYKSVEHSPSWAVNNGSGSQETYRVYKRQPLTKSCPQPDKSGLHDHIPSLEYPF